MKNVEMSDASYAALQRLAAAKRQTPAEMLAALLDSRRPISGDPLLFHLTSGDFSGLPEPADRYLALLAGIARHHAADFTDFISHRSQRLLDVA